jgi:hypothetical protein
VGKKSGSGVRDEHPGSYFRALRNNIFGLKILTYFDADPDPGSGIFLIRVIRDGKFRILDKHPGSATL